MTFGSRRLHTYIIMYSNDSDNTCISKKYPTTQSTAMPSMTIHRKSEEFPPPPVLNGPASYLLQFSYNTYRCMM